MGTLSFRYARVEDAELLAPLNAQLIRDESHRNSMSEAQLAERVAAWLESDYSAVIVKSGKAIVGYALWRTGLEFIYLRQLFVVPAFRRRGVGRQTLNWLWKNTWVGSPRLRIDVLIGNTAAISFWRAIGFHDYCLTMEMERK